MSSVVDVVNFLFYCKLMNWGLQWFIYHACIKQGKRNPYFIMISSYYGRLFYLNVVRFRELVGCAEN